MWRRVWIWERSLKNGKVYCVRWYDDSGRIRTEAVGADRERAERVRDQRAHELNSGQLRTLRHITFDDFRKEDVQVMRARLAPGSLVELDRTLRCFGQKCKNKMLLSVSPALVEGHFSERLQGVSPATANKELRTLKASFNRAVQRCYLESNPAKHIRQVREPEREIRVLSVDETEQILRACPSLRWRALVALAVTTGMRLGEMLALRWSDLDLESGVAWVRNTPEHLTKSRKNRVVGLFPAVGVLLKTLPRRDERVFTTQEGTSWRNNVQRGFRAIVKRAGIRHCSIHDLRRTFVSHLATAGVNEAMVQRLAGHASISTTLKYYTNLVPEALMSAQARLPFNSALLVISDSYHGPETPADNAQRQLGTPGARTMEHVESSTVASRIQVGLHHTRQ